MRTYASLVLLVALTGCGQTTDIVGSRSDESSTETPTNPRDVLGPRLGVPESESEAAIRTAFDQLFFGDPDNEAFYRLVGDDAAYIYNVKEGDVRTDSIGYGMLVTVQLDEQEIFDKLWTWAKRYMLETEPPREGILSWQCTTEGTECSGVTATDATTVIATALFMAEAEWGGDGAHEYASDAHAVIDAMVETEERNDGVVENVRNPFDVAAALPRKTSSAGDDEYLKPDYLMPAFYEYWASFRTEDASFWLRAARNSRELMQSAFMEENGLIPVQITADGLPAPAFEYYNELAARALLNRWLDFSWFGEGAWVSEANGLLLDFFIERQAESEYVSSYYLDGRVRGTNNTPAHLALVATAAAASENHDDHDAFLQALVDEPIPEGMDRYYQGMLYLVCWMAVSGRLEPLGL